MTSAIQRQYAVLLPALILAVLVGVGWHGVGAGIATHGDSRTVIEQSVPAILHGSYFPSRSYGNPLYEYIAAASYAVGGIAAVNFMSLLFSIGAAVGLYRLLRVTTLGRRSIVLAAVCYSPLFLVNSFAAAEWSLALFMLIWLLVSATRWLDEPSERNIAQAAAFGAGLVLTRPDAAILVAAVCAAMIWQTRFTAWRSIGLLLGFGLAACIAALVFVLLNGGFEFLKTGVIFNTAPYSRRALLALAGLYTTIGPVAAVMIVVALVAAFRGRLSFYDRVFLIAAPLLLARYFVMPDKIEYIIYLVPLSALLLAGSRLSWPWLLVFAGSMILPSVVTLSIFDRPVGGDKLVIAPHFGPGAVSQDLAAMRYNWALMNDPRYLDAIADAVYGAKPHPTVRSENWAAGLLASNGDLIIGRTETYHFGSVNDRNEARFQRPFRAMYVCNRSVWINGEFGWRQAKPAVLWPALDAHDLVCVLER